MQNVKVTFDGKDVDFASLQIDITSNPTAPPPPTTGGVDLNIWKLTLPTGSGSKPTEIFQPALANYADANFVRNDDGSLTFRARVDGVTTSSSGYPRSELREMKAGGKDLASWSTSSGTNTMTITQACGHLPVAKPQVTCGQLHDGNDDVVGIVVDGTHGDGVTKPARILARLKGKYHATPIIAEYMLGDTFTITITASGGKITIAAGAKVTHTLSTSRSGCYFKAGCYTQSNLAKGDKPDAFGEVRIFDLRVSHG